MHTLHTLVRQVQVRTWLLMVLGPLLILIAAGYIFNLQWTGFPSKNLFDWLSILVFPAVVAVGTFTLNRAAKRRDEAAEQRAQEKALEREFRKDLLQAYNAAKRVRRALRAKVHNGGSMIDTTPYDELMQELIDVQLRFEFLSDEAKALFPRIDAEVEENSEIQSALDTAENYLQDIIDEYSDEYDGSKNEPMRISDLPELGKFIERVKEAKKRKEGSRFKQELSDPVHKAGSIVLKKLLSSAQEDAKAAQFPRREVREVVP